MDTLTFVYCYDVESDRTRAKLARYLEARAVRVQKSVFEAQLSHAAAQALFAALVQRLDPGDSLRMYALPASSLARSRAHGGAPLPEEGAFWIL